MGITLLQCFGQACLWRLHSLMLFVFSLRWSFCFPRTKEIKSSGPNNGSRLRKIVRNIARNSQNPSTARSSRSQAVSSSTQRKQATASVHAQPRVTPASRAALSTSPNGRISPFPTSIKEKNGSAATTSVVVTAAMGFGLRLGLIWSFVFMCKCVFKGVGVLECLGACLDGWSVLGCLGVCWDIWECAVMFFMLLGLCWDGWVQWYFRELK